MTITWLDASSLYLHLKKEAIWEVYKYDVLFDRNICAVIVCDHVNIQQALSIWLTYNNLSS